MSPSPVPMATSKTARRPAAKKKGAGKKGRRFTVRLELGLGGIAAVAVVLACIFLWMFLLGVWAGQTVLHGDRTVATVGKQDGGRWLAPVRDLARRLTAGDSAQEEAEPEYSAETFFSLQVGAYDDETAAARAAAQYRGQGYDAFYTRPRGREQRYRVFTGRFDTLERANEMAAAFSQRHHLTPYITLLEDNDPVQP